MKLDDDEAEAETTKKSCPSQASTVGAAKGKTKSRKRKRAPILLLLSGKYSSLSGEITLHPYTSKDWLVRALDLL